MEKVNLTNQFAYRLRDAMIAAGFNSPRSSSGVSMNKLAEITGYSLQICRKYLRGAALPEPAKLMEIAQKLNVSAGWLLFGEAHNLPNESSGKITLSKNLLRYILSKAACLYNDKSKVAEVSDFLVELFNDLSQINADEEQSKKIVDLALSSIRHFSYPPGNAI